MGKIEFVLSLALFTAVYGQQFGQQQQLQQPQQQRGFGQQQQQNQNGQFAAVQRQNQQSPSLGGPSNLNNPNRQGANNLNQKQRQGSNQGRLAVQQQQQLLLSGQPSLVNIGGCSRGVSLRNSDGSTLVCGFGPRDFECPPGFSCTFDNGLKALVCCPNENNNNTRKAPEKEEDQPNPCPDHEPIKDEFGHRLKCDLASGPANACPAGTLCVVGACCPVSVAGLISVKPGKCPLPLPVSPGQNCQNDCTFDADCPGPAKCCFVGCGARCVASVNNPEPQQAPQAPNQINGPLSGNGASIAQFNLQRNGPQGPQSNNPFFNQQSKQFQFPNNGPPGTSRSGPPGQQQQRSGGLGAQQQTSGFGNQQQQSNGFGQQQQPNGFGAQQQTNGQRQPQFQNNNNGFGNGNTNVNRNRQFDQAMDE